MMVLTTLGRTLLVDFPSCSTDFVFKVNIYCNMNNSFFIEKNSGKRGEPIQEFQCYYTCKVCSVLKKMVY